MRSIILGCFSSFYCEIRWWTWAKPTGRCLLLTRSWCISVRKLRSPGFVGPASSSHCSRKRGTRRCLAQNQVHSSVCETTSKRKFYPRVDYSRGILSPLLLAHSLFRTPVLSSSQRRAIPSFQIKIFFSSLVWLLCVCGTGDFQHNACSFSFLYKYALYSEPRLPNTPDHIYHLRIITAHNYCVLLKVPIYYSVIFLGSSLWCSFRLCLCNVVRGIWIPPVGCCPKDGRPLPWGLCTSCVLCELAFPPALM
jgi:hypothetical protein